ncbi:conserved hypothetical protein [Uncinocarpus reesii 1704]|uniref:Cofilin n=1 Tax=Uncinocarpus reesii (strain UAMH 1704) TaxID=336963 RepID=C4JMP8_UNCRE|nr:uncharacterized protein UREG_04106 [Uncinocarpus reesii 1704]EEP79260.1 conserved hypothetical protein [Uncinocarpus reesii 1704]
MSVRALSSLSTKVSIHPDCITAYNELRLGRGKTKFIIFKIADNRREIVVDEASGEPDYEVFREKLENAKDSKGAPAPRYAVYDVEFELEGGEGKRNKIVFISWVPNETPTFWSMLYATSRQTLKNAINPHTSIHADDKAELEWKYVLAEASGHKATK